MFQNRYFLFWIAAFVHAAVSLHVVKKPETSSEKLSLCKDGLSRIPNAFVCDGSKDCDDGSDEQNCGVRRNPLTKDYDMYSAYLRPEMWMLETNETRLHKTRYKWFWETYRPVAVENVPQPGESFHSAEVWKLRAHHSSKKLLKKDFMHDGVGFILKDVEGRELGRYAFQYWAACQWGAAVRAPASLNQTGFKFDKQGRSGWHNQAVLTFSRSKGNWENGYWSNNTLISTINEKKWKHTVSFLNHWQKDHRQFMVLGFIYNVIPDEQMEQHPNFIHYQFMSPSERQTVPGVMNCSRLTCIRPQARDAYHSFGNVLAFQHACPFFVSEVIKKATGTDLFLFRDENHGGIQSLLREVEPVELFAPAKRAEDYLQAGKLNMKWLRGDDSEGYLVIPAFYDAHGHPLEQEDFVSKVHIVKPVDRLILGHDEFSMKKMKPIKYHKKLIKGQRRSAQEPYVSL